MESLEDLRNRLLREERVQLMVRTRAFEIYQMRGGQPGWEARDWFQAEAEVLAFLIALESRLEDEKTAAESTPAVSAREASQVSEAPATAGAAHGKKAIAPKASKSRSASRVTSAKPAKKTAPTRAASSKPESRPKVKGTSKSSKQEKSD
jgi:Protein of unknown function (DUF2934)